MARKPRSRSRPVVASLRRLAWTRARSLARPAAVAVALALAGAGTYALARATPAFAVREVRVEGAPPHVARDVRRTLRPLAGRSLLAIDDDAVTGRLAALPAVRSAEYDRAFPDTLVVLVRPERPAAVLRAGASAWLVSARGRVLRGVARGKLRRLPRVWLPARTTLLPGATVADAEALAAVRVAAFAAEEGFEHRITLVSARRGRLVLRVGAGTREVRLGDQADLALKLAVASAVLRRLPPIAAGGPAYVDVGNPERPVAGGTLKPKVEVETSEAEIPSESD
ncbi:MAG: FtsQ-type POTRA domain-containing protein [Thermoleophilia bacterium]|nr:FtsQ-type POTRA domain-containing protein [Thermoleophilia bacterium]